MGLTFSSPDLQNGLVTAPGVPAPTESYGFQPPSTNSFGIRGSVSATITDQKATPVFTFPAATGVDTVTCQSISLTPLPGQVVTYSGSILCPYANSRLAPGTATVRFIASTTTDVDGVPGQPTTTNLPGTSVFVIATASSTSTTTTTTLTGLTVAEFTTTFITPSTTEFYTPTTTLTGASSTSYISCSTSQSVLALASSSSRSMSTSMTISSYSRLTSEAAASHVSFSSIAHEGHHDGHHEPFAGSSVTYRATYTRNIDMYTFRPSLWKSEDSAYSLSDATSGSWKLTGGFNYKPTLSPSKPDNSIQNSSHGSASGYSNGHDQDPVFTSLRAHGYGGSCQRKRLARAVPAPTPVSLQRRDAGYGGPSTTFLSFATVTATSMSTLPPVTLPGVTTTITSTSGITTVIVTTTMVTSDLRTIATVNTCSTSATLTSSLLLP